MKRVLLAMCAPVILFSLLIKCSNNAGNNSASDTRKQTAAANQNNIANPDPIEALNNPSKHAWDLFLYVNHPARNYKLGRGIPDSAKKIGDSGLALWETWKDAGKEVFLANGQAPPQWDDFSLDPYLSNKGKSFEATTATLISEMKKNPKQNPEQLLKSMSNPIHLNFNPNDGLFGSGGGESRMNKSTFDFIVKNILYNTQGIIKYRADYLNMPAGQRQRLNFEKESIEVKAMWKKFTDDELKNNEDKKYYVAKDGSGAIFGLTSLHIITKEIPNWFWCSFRHSGGPKPQIPSVDTYGQPAVLKGTVWENYELSGTQTTFTDAKGTAIKLSDPFVESGFENSSCMSCHATSVAGPNGGKLLFTDPVVHGSGNPGEIFGTPNEKWFLDANGNELYVQLDFVYSISFRAQPKQ